MESDKYLHLKKKNKNGKFQKCLNYFNCHISHLFISIVNRFLSLFSSSLVSLIASSYFWAHIIGWFTWSLVLPKMPITALKFTFVYSHLLRAFFVCANVWLRLIGDLRISTFFPLCFFIFSSIWNTSNWWASLSSHKILRE